MPYIVLAIGIILAWLDYEGADNIRQAGSLTKQELWSGNPSFWKWAGALIIVGAIGYIPDMDGIATAMLVLIILVMVLANNSGFAQLLAKA